MFNIYYIDAFNSNFLIFNIEIIYFNVYYKYKIYKCLYLVLIIILTIINIVIN